MKCRHRVGRNTAFETISHHEVVTCAQLFEKRAEICEVIAVVGVAHDDVLAACGFNAGKKGVAITFFGHVNHPRA